MPSTPQQRKGSLPNCSSLRPPRPLNLLLQREGAIVVLQDADRQDWLAAAAHGAPIADLGRPTSDGSCCPRASALTTCRSRAAAGAGPSCKTAASRFLRRNPHRRTTRSSHQARHAIEVLRPARRRSILFRRRRWRGRPALGLALGGAGARRAQRSFAAAARPGTQQRALSRPQRRAGTGYVRAQA